MPNTTDPRIDDVASLVGQGVHSMLRKGCSSGAASRAWSAIRAMPDDEWEMVCRTVAQHLIDHLDRDTP